MLLTEHHLEFLSLKGGCTCSSESTLVKMHIVGNHMSGLICFYTEKPGMPGKNGAPGAPGLQGEKGIKGATINPTAKRHCVAMPFRWWADSCPL